jgi:hypothetical protein
MSDLPFTAQIYLLGVYLVADSYLWPFYKYEGLTRLLEDALLLGVYLVT